VLDRYRCGWANRLPSELPIPSGMLAAIEGAAFRSAMGTAGRIAVRISRGYEDIATGRSGIVTSFSSAGPTAFGHQLKPDVAAPGGQILSSTLPAVAGTPFACSGGHGHAHPA